jgi:hypothetical protein
MEYTSIQSKCFNVHNFASFQVSSALTPKRKKDTNSTNAIIQKRLIAERIKPM